MLTKFDKSIKPVPQEHPMGCSVACVASLCGVSYKKALSLFEVPELAWRRGYYCGEIVSALAKKNLNYKFAEFEKKKHSEKLNRVGTIVFTAPDRVFPAGHFFLRTQKGWMNPWSNYPQMVPVESAIQKELKGKISYIIFEKEPASD